MVFSLDLWLVGVVGKLLWERRLVKVNIYFVTVFSENVLVNYGFDNFQHFEITVRTKVTNLQLNEVLELSVIYVICHSMYSIYEIAFC